jgi:hypothetical protein
MRKDVWKTPACHKDPIPTSICHTWVTNENPVAVSGHVLPVHTRASRNGADGPTMKGSAEVRAGDRSTAVGVRKARSSSDGCVCVVVVCELRVVQAREAGKRLRLARCGTRCLLSGASDVNEVTLQHPSAPIQSSVQVAIVPTHVTVCPSHGTVGGGVGGVARQEFQ